MNDIFPCLGAVGSLAIIFGFLAFLRYMNYKETIALAEKGLTKPETKLKQKNSCAGGSSSLQSDSHSQSDFTSLALILPTTTRFTSDPGCWEASSHFFLALAWSCFIISPRRINFRENLRYEYSKSV